MLPSIEMASLDVIVVPRWGGRGKDDFYPWLATELATEIDDLSFDVLDLPEPNKPTLAAWPTCIAARLAGASPGPRMIIAHSVGVRATLHALALEATPAIGGLLCVAGWASVDKPWPEIVPWIEEPLDTAAARAHAGKVRLLVSDDDPFTADHAATRAWFERELRAVSRLAPGGRHFNGKQEPIVLEEALTLARALSGERS